MEKKVKQISGVGKAYTTLLCNYRTVNFMDKQNKQEKQARVCGRGRKNEN